MMGLSGQVSALTSLEDQELSEVNGQALLSMEVQSGFNQMDNLGATYDQSNISFYKYITWARKARRGTHHKPKRTKKF